MPPNSASKNAGQTPLHSLFHYQKSKTQLFLRWLSIVAIFLCILAAGLGSLWYFKSSWVALVFAIIFAAMGLGLSGLAFFIGEKIDMFNTVASGALNVYDMAQKNSTIIDMENDANTQQHRPAEVKELENTPAAAAPDNTSSSQQQ